mgnify:CR=1
KTVLNVPVNDVVIDGLEYSRIHESTYNKNHGIVKKMSAGIGGGHRSLADSDADDEEEPEVELTEEEKAA